MRQVRQILGHAPIAEVCAHLGLVRAGADHALAELVALSELEAHALPGGAEVAWFGRVAECRGERARDLALLRIARRGAECEALEHLSPVVLAALDDRLAAAGVLLAVEAHELVDDAHVAGVVQEAAVGGRFQIDAHPERDGWTKGLGLRELDARRRGFRAQARADAHERKQDQNPWESAHESNPRPTSPLRRRDEPA